MLCTVAMVNFALEDTLARYTLKEFAACFKKTLAFQPRVIEQNRGSTRENIWIIQLKAGSYCTSPDIMAFTGAKDLQFKVAMLNFGSQDMLACYILEEFAAGLKKTQAFQLSSS